MRRRSPGCLAAAMGLAQLFSASASHGVDGVIEINNASILAAGGYPFFIGVPGSYVLTGDLTPPPFASALLVAGPPNVEIDLNGFAISTVFPVFGVEGISAAGSIGLTVRGGVIEGFGGAGIAAGSDAKIFQNRISGNGAGITGVFQCLIVENVVTGNVAGFGYGIEAQNCKIENNIVQGNGDAGIFGLNNLIVHNQISGNAGGGISLAPFAGGKIQENVIEGNAAFGIADLSIGAPPPPVPMPGFPRVNIIGNTVTGSVAGPGIYIGGPALITDNTVADNFDTGIVCGAACVVNGNAVDSNNTGLAPASGGVSVGEGSSVTDNVISFNLGGFGLSIPTTSGYSQNTLTFNGFGIDVFVLPFPPHPTSGFMNLCSGFPCP